MLESSAPTPRLLTVGRAGQVYTMAEVPEDRMAAALAARVSAYALTRATVAQDEDAAVFLVSDARRVGSLNLLVLLTR